MECDAVRFYELPEPVRRAVEDKTIRPYIIISYEADGIEQKIISDIIECEISSYREDNGGIINKGTLILDNTARKYTPELTPSLVPDTPVTVTYCFGDESKQFMRFTLYVDHNGFQAESDGTDGRTCTVKLTDLSTKIKKLSNQNDWLETQTAVHCIVCDKTQPEKSLVHIIAARAKLKISDIDCCSLPFIINYCEITKSVWDELSELARAYGADLECGKDTPLTFTGSPYDPGSTADTESSYELAAADITHYRRFDSYEDYANSIRVKYTRYTETERTELWRLSEAPVWFDEQMNAYYPFTNTRDIERNGDEVVYSVKNIFGKTQTVVYAEEIDSAEIFKSNIVTKNGEKMTVVKYDTASYRTKALLKVTAPSSGALVKSMAISGRAIVAEQNFCVYRKDEDEITKRGLTVLNDTNRYLSDTLFNGTEQYKVYADQLLNKKKKLYHCYFVKTNKALLHARAGAYMSIHLGADGTGAPVETEITELTLRYKKDAAFETTLWLKTL
jgi:hypothetical protein